MKLYPHEGLPPSRLRKTSVPPSCSRVGNDEPVALSVAAQLDFRLAAGVKPQSAGEGESPDRVARGQERSCENTRLRAR